MKTRLSDATFSFNGLSLAVGALGFLSGFVQLFVDTSSQISVKWLLLTVWLALSLVLVLLKVVYDLHHEKRPAPPFEVPIKYLPEKQILVIRRNDNFLNNIVVGCYIKQDEVDTLAWIGYVHIVQEKFIQIKIQGNFLGQNSPSTSSDFLTSLVIRPVVPIDALTNISNTGN
jgi:hypothetical protein